MDRCASRGERHAVVSEDRGALSARERPLRCQLGTGLTEGNADGESGHRHESKTMATSAKSPGTSLRSRLGRGAFIAASSQPARRSAVEGEARRQRLVRDDPR